MSEDMMDFGGDRSEEIENTYSIRCDHCERDVEHSVSTGEPIKDEGSCSDMNCEVLSSARNGGDPLELNFDEDRGC